MQKTLSFSNLCAISTGYETGGEQAWIQDFEMGVEFL